MKKLLAVLLAVMLMALSACSGTDTPAQTDDPGADSAGIRYDYQLKAGEQIEVYDVTFDQMVTVTVDPASTRNGPVEERSSIYFDGCTFNGGLTIVGDYHAMVTLGTNCSFGADSVVTCQEATPGVSRDITLEDNLVKVFASCEGVRVETEAAVGVLTNGPDVVVNGTTYSKGELAPDTALLGVYSIYENDAMTYPKLAIGEDDSIEFLD